MRDRGRLGGAGATPSTKRDPILTPVEMRAVDDPGRHAEDAERDRLFGARAKVVLDRRRVDGGEDAFGVVTASRDDPRDDRARSPMSALSTQYARIERVDDARIDARGERGAQRLHRPHRMVVGIVSFTPKRFAHRCMSAMLCAAFAATSVAKSFCGVSLARKTPPRSNGRYVSATPIRFASAGAWVEPRYAYGQV